MNTHDTWNLRFDDLYPRYVDTDEDRGGREWLERGLLVVVVVVFVVLAGWHVLGPVADVWASIGAALDAAGAAR